MVFMQYANSMNHHPTARIKYSPISFGQREKQTQKEEIISVETGNKPLLQEQSDKGTYWHPQPESNRAFAVGETAFLTARRWGPWNAEYYTPLLFSCQERIPESNSSLFPIQHRILTHNASRPGGRRELCRDQSSFLRTTSTFPSQKELHRKRLNSTQKAYCISNAVCFT